MIYYCTAPYSLRLERLTHNKAMMDVSPIPTASPMAAVTDAITNTFTLQV